MKKIFATVLVVLVLALLFVGSVAAKAPDQGSVSVPQVQVSAAKADTSPLEQTLPIKDLLGGGAIIVMTVNGLVELIKKLGVTGKWSTASAMVIGVVIGVAYAYYLTPLTTYASWFLALLYGLFLGFVACKIYDVYGNKITSSDTTAS